MVTLDTRIQGRIRVHTRTRGHDLWKTMDITEAWEYIRQSPLCKALSITDSHTLYYTIIHILEEFDVITMFRLPESQSHHQLP